MHNRAKRMAARRKKIFAPPSGVSVAPMFTGYRSQGLLDVVVGRFGRGERRRFLAAVRSLRDEQRFDDADRLVEGRLASNPDEFDLLAAYAWNAHNRGDHEEAMRRWETALKVKKTPVAYSEFAGSARELGQIARALEIIEEAQRRFPNHLSVIEEAARIASRRGDYGGAVSFWKQAIAASDENASPERRQGYIHNLILLGRLDEAREQIDAAAAIDPLAYWVLALRGILAEATRDWDAAAAIWSEYRTRFPDDPVGWEHWGRSVQGQQLALAETPAAPSLAKRATTEQPESSPPGVELVEDAEIRQLLLGFESLGDDCEFGIVQRRYGAEPLGLLRWNKAPFEALLAAVSERFADMGEPEHTELSPTSNGEYYIRDRRWGLGMHTFIFAGQESFDSLYPKICRRVQYLRDKLITDLRDAEKIFVFKSEHVTIEKARELHRSLRMIGPVKLLHVTLPSEAAPAESTGKIVKVDDDLYRGFVGRFGVVHGWRWDVAFEDWLSVCRRAVLFDAASS
jgi:tetratricopeptide (TPR) repeat protein